MRSAGSGAAALALLAAAAGGAGAQPDLATLPLEDPGYAQLAGLARQGCVAARVSPFRPYLVGRVRRAVAEAAAERGCAGPLLDALRARFRRDTAAARAPGPAPADSTALEVVAAREPAAEPSALSVGAALSVRLTAHRGREFVPLWREARAASQGDPAVVGVLRARLTWAGGERLVAVTDAYAQSHRRNDPRVRGRAFRETSGVLDFSEAYLTGQLGPLVLSVGRTQEAWLGEGDESLMLSAHGPPLDRIVASARWPRVEARALLASLNDVVLDVALDSLAPGTPPQRYHRLLVAHAVTIGPWRGWEISAGETALLTRRGGGIDLAFANPLMPFLVTEHDTARAGGSADDNNLTVFGGVRYARARATFDAELVIDDIQIDRADRRRIPDQLAWRIAAAGAVPLPLPTIVGLEYSRVDSYTYLRDNFAEVYANYDQPLGSRLGPDADLWRARSEAWPTGLIRLAASVARWRRGALRLDQRPARGAFGHAGEPFPSVGTGGLTAQEAWLASGSARLLTTALPVEARVDAARVRNVNNTPSGAATYMRAQFVVTYRFRYP